MAKISESAKKGLESALKFSDEAEEVVLKQSINKLGSLLDSTSKSIDNIVDVYFRYNNDVIEDVGSNIAKEKADVSIIT